MWASISTACASFVCFSFKDFSLSFSTLFSSFFSHIFHFYFFRGSEHTTDIIVKHKYWVAVAAWAQIKYSKWLTASNCTRELPHPTECESSERSETWKKVYFQMRITQLYTHRHMKISYGIFDSRAVCTLCVVLKRQFHFNSVTALFSHVYSRREQSRAKIALRRHCACYAGISPNQNCGMSEQCSWSEFQLKPI